MRCIPGTDDGTDRIPFAAGKGLRFFRTGGGHVPSIRDRAQADSMSVVTTQIFQNPLANEEESSRLRQVATRHGLSGDALIRLVSESRKEARDRRRRLSDARLSELIRDLGGTS